MIGPDIELATDPAPQRAMAIPRWAAGKLSMTTAWPVAVRAPPPKPWKTRRKTKMGRVGAIPARALQVAKRTVQKIKKRFLPKKVANQPVMGRIMAVETRYAVRTQATSSTSAERPPCIWGRVMLTTLTSRISIPAASEAMMAMIHLFIPDPWSRKHRHPSDEGYLE